MARKSNKKKFTSVPGPKAWIVYRQPSVGEIEQISELDEGSAFSAGKKLIVDHVVEWNWSDEDDNPLPLPGEKLPGTDTLVVDDLTLEEFTQLSELLLSKGGSDRKN